MVSVCSSMLPRGPDPYTAFFWKGSEHNKGRKRESYVDRNLVLPSQHVITHPWSCCPQKSQNAQMGLGSFKGRLGKLP